MNKTLTTESIIDWNAIDDQHTILSTIPELIRQSASQLQVTAGTTLFSRGEPPRAVLYVLTGEVRLIRHSLEGSEITLQRSRSGFIAEASMEANAYHCDVVIAENSELLLFPLTEFRAALEVDTTFNRAWIKMQSFEIRRLRAQCERLSLNSASERILHYIETEGSNNTITLTQSRKAWANELGLSHEVVYRTLSTLRDSKKINIENKQITLNT